MSDVDVIIDELRKTFEENANAVFAEGMHNYMKGQYNFYGIKMGPRRQLARPFFQEAKRLSKKELLECADRLYKEPKHEMHHMAVEFLEKNLKGDKLEKSDMKVFEKMVLKHSWWDTVDVIAPRLMARYFEKFPEERNKKVDEWIASGNTWLIRCSLLFQLKAKDKTDVPYLFETILRVSHTKEFFINKAIGWMLRELSKQDPDTVRDFIEENEDKLSNLSKREGLKYC